jgi:hypothetical protein
MGASIVVLVKRALAASWGGKGLVEVVSWAFMEVMVQLVSDVNGHSSINNKGKIGIIDFQT